jgi:hypothetical protein
MAVYRELFGKNESKECEINKVYPFLKPEKSENNLFFAKKFLFRSFRVFIGMSQTVESFGNV